MAHDPFGPSQLGRLLKCPASHRLSKDEPERTSDDAKEGTLLHKAFERYWTGDTGWSGQLEPEQTELVEKCIDFADCFATLPGASIWCERRVELIGDAGTVVNHGTADMIVGLPRKRIVIDLKFGRKIDDDALVLQLANYMAADASSLDGSENIEWFEGWAFFPRLGEELKWEHPGPANALIDEVTAQVLSIKEKCSDESLEPVPGTHCDYCRHLPNCAAVRDKTGAELKKADPERLLEHPERVAELYDMGTLAEKQFKAIKGKIREILFATPDALPGLRLLDTRGKRKTSSMAKLYLRVVPELLAQEEWQALVHREVRPVELEKAVLQKLYQGRGKGLPTQKAIKARLADVAGDAIKAGKEKKLRRVNVE